MVRRRWTRSSRLYLAASVILALLTGSRIHAYVERASAASRALGSPVRVVIASERVARGRPVAPGDLSVRLVPRTYAPPGALSQVSQAAGRVALTDLAPGEAVTDTRLARVRAGPVASLVPQGLRAFAVPTSLPAGVLTAGDRVDVLATFGSGQPHTETVVEGVEVLLVLGGTAEQPEGPGGIGPDLAGAGLAAPIVLIVLVAPEQEERLAFARAFANLEVAITSADEGPAMPAEGSQSG